MPDEEEHQEEHKVTVRTCRMLIDQMRRRSKRHKGEDIEISNAKEATKRALHLHKGFSIARNGLQKQHDALRCSAYMHLESKGGATPNAMAHASSLVAIAMQRLIQSTSNQSAEIEQPEGENEHARYKEATESLRIEIKNKSAEIAALDAKAISLEAKVVATKAHASAQLNESNQTIDDLNEKVSSLERRLAENEKESRERETALQKELADQKAEKEKTVQRLQQEYSDCMALALAGVKRGKSWRSVIFNEPIV